MKLQILKLALIFSLALIPYSSSQAITPRELVIDQQQGQVGVGHGLLEGSPKWQEFLPQMNNLSGVDVALLRWGDPQNDVLVSVTDFSGNILWSGEIANADVPEDTGWVTVTGTGTTPLMPGAHYRIVLEGIGPDEDAHVVWLGSNNSGYVCCESNESWDVFVIPDFYDFAFRTWGHDNQTGAVVDQEQTGTSYGYVTWSGITRWQEFVPDLTELMGMVLQLHRDGDLTGLLDVRLVDSANRTLYETQCEAIDVGESSHWLTFHFPDPIPVAAGAIYRIEVAGSFPQEEGYIAWRGESDSGYEQGNADVGGTFDYAFQVFGLPENAIESWFTSITTDLVGNLGAGSGLNLLDLDNDGDIDAYVINQNGDNQLLLNNGELDFEDLATGPVIDPGPSVAASWADFDSDGDQDLYMTRDGEANFLLKNDGSLGFHDVTPAGLDNSEAGRGTSWVDYNGDGLLDLFLVNHQSSNLLFQYLGEFGDDFHIFTLVGGPHTDTGSGTMGVWSDFDQDGDQDLYIVRPFSENLLIENFTTSGFQIIPNEMNDNGNGRAAAWGDYDNDGLMDLYLSNESNPDRLYHNNSTGFNSILGQPLNDPFAGRAVVWFDADNDMDLDVYLGRYDQSDILLLNDGNGGFVHGHIPFNLMESRTTAAAAADLDDDGDLDLFVVRNGQANAILRNDIPDPGNWLGVRLVGGEGMNRDAIGARVRILAGGVYQVREIQSANGYYSQSPYRVHFGLANEAQVDSLIVIWPNGEQSVETSVTPNQILTVSPNTTSGVNDGTLALPSALRFNDLWPNPFNPSTTMSFTVPRTGRVVLDVLDLSGARVETIVDGILPAGQHLATWEGKDGHGRRVASGVFVFRLQGPGGTTTRTAVLVK